MCLNKVKEEVAAKNLSVYHYKLKERHASTRKPNGRG
jgi:hypothetical protein